MNIITALVITILIILLAIELLIGIYFGTIVCVKRFHTTTHFLTAHFCLTMGIAALFWIIYHSTTVFYPSIGIAAAFCMFTRIGPDLVNGLGLYALLLITINRYLVIANPTKRFYQKHRWFAILSTMQWLLMLVLIIPQAVLGTYVSVTKKCANKTIHRSLSRNVFTVNHGYTNYVSIA